MKFGIKSLLSVTVFATLLNFAGCDLFDFGLNGNGADEAENVVYTQADVCGTWKFTTSQLSFESTFDANGIQVSTTMEPNAATASPSSLTISESGAVYGKYVRSGGSGALIWTRTDAFSGQMSSDKKKMTGVSTYSRTGTSGTSKSENDMTVEKIRDCDEGA